MEDIIVALNNIADVMHNNGLPVWMSVLAVVVPIIQTMVIIFLTIIQDKRGKELQKQIANRDMINQVRHNILQIYNAFLVGLNICIPAETSVAGIFVSHPSIYKWAQDLESANSQIMYAYNQANLLVDDKDLNDVLRKCMQSFGELYQTVSLYLNSGIPNQTIVNAWNEITPKSGIMGGDYQTLCQNQVWAERFTNLCENSYTRDIQSKAKNYIALVHEPSFDEKFKKYVRIEELK